LDALALKFGVPFAKAFATFVHELARHEEAMPSDDSILLLDEPVRAKVAETGSETTVLTPEQMPPDMKAEFEAQFAEYEAAKAAGKLDAIEFTADMPAQMAGNRLRRVLAEKKITQSELAKRLKVSPAVVNRVLKNPDRSMVATLRRIADALGVELVELID
jgi:DNA-binding Xre family transcriptional regulator